MATQTITGLVVWLGAECSEGKLSEVGRPVGLEKAGRSQNLNSTVNHKRLTHGKTYHDPDAKAS